MKHLVLISQTSSPLKEGLANHGYVVNEFTAPLSEGSTVELNKFRQSGTLALDINSDAIEGVLNVLDCDQWRVVCNTGTVPPGVKTLLLKNGVSDVLDARSGEHLAAFLESINEETETYAGNILVYDDNKGARRILQNIILRFGFKAIFVDSLEGLFDQLVKPNVQFILVNLGSESVDVHKLIKKSYSYNVIKSIPLIAYKDISKGLFLHEVVSGLNRLTRVIMGTDELYSFLVDMLFRKAIITQVALLNGAVDLKKHQFCIDETLSRIYLQNENMLFDLDNILDDKNFSAIGASIDRLKDLIVKSEGLKWLRIENHKSDINIAGRGG